MWVMNINVMDGQGALQVVVQDLADAERLRRYQYAANACINRCAELDEQEDKKCSQST